MREIKFRAWVDKSMIYFDNPKTGIQYRCGKMELSIGWDSYKQPIYFDSDEYNPKPKPEFEIMQYTGLKDKNGKEVFESDIVYWKHVDSYGVVYYNDDEVSFLSKPIRTHDETESYLDSTHMEVIGNIYEDPELL